MEKKFYTAKYDAVFKAIFCSPKNKDLLQTLLERCLNTKVSIISIMAPEILKKNVYVKNKTLDVLVKAKGYLINVEINSEYYRALIYRNSGYIYEKYAELAKVGDNYSHMPKVIQINFTCGLPENHPAKCCYVRYDPKEKIEYKDNLTIYEYNVDKIKKMCYNGDTKYDYIAALDYNKEEINKYCKEDKYMDKFKKEVDKLNADIEFTEFLSAEEDAQKVHNTLIIEAKEQGYIAGELYGEKKGEKKGAMEKAAIIAKNLLDLNINISDIEAATGLNKKEIIALKNK